MFAQRFTLRLTRFPRFARLALLAGLALSTAACGDMEADGLEGEAAPAWAGLTPPAAVGKADDARGLPDRAIEVGVFQRQVPTGCTPTYGSPCTEPAVKVRVRVDDALVQQAHPGFDGLEQAFVLLPWRDDDGALQWSGHAVPWSHISRHGYYAELTADVHQTEWLRGVDLATIEAEGVAVGLDTNVGLIWAQAPGENHPLAPAGVTPGYL
ncbi:MAG: hypothetical protein H6702_22665 [Myxococcales bacterium]|nr:hypothetical protein [Myxococcales bacterium]